jgi:c-di-GMP phosphodiesterase
MNETVKETDHGAAAQVVVRRDAVFDERERVAGYELILDDAPPTAGSETADLIATVFGDLGLRRLVGEHSAYIAATPEVPADIPALGLPAGQLVLMLAEQPVDERRLHDVARLVEAGFGVGVGGWALDRSAEALLALATAVKVDFDFGTLDVTRVVARRDELHERGVTLIAANLQTRGEYAECRRLGFDAFMGEFLTTPSGLAGRRTPTAGMQTLTAVLRATGPEAFEDLERVICRDVGLAHRFLRLADSAFYARRARVRSVRDALARLGAEAVRQWALMLVLAGVADTSSGTARHLLGVGLHRARICELLARDNAEACPDRAFSAGLLSILPALVNHPIDQLVAELPIEQALAGALTAHEGTEGQMLAAAIDYEQGERETADGQPPLLAAITRIYTDALLWADSTAHNLG